MRESEALLEEEIGQLEEAIEDYPEQVEALEEDIQACEDEMGDLAEDIEEQEANIEDAENAYDESVAEAESQYQEAMAETAAEAAALGAALGAQIGSDVANTGDNGGTDNPWDNPATAGKNPDSDNPDANKDLTWWQELCRAIQQGIDNTLNYGWPLGGMGGTGLGDVKFPSEDELARRLDISPNEIHDVKEEIKKAFTDELNQLKTTNPDIGYDSAGNIVLRNPKTRQAIRTGVPLGTFGK